MLSGSAFFFKKCKSPVTDLEIKSYVRPQNYPLDLSTVYIITSLFLNLLNLLFFPFILKLLKQKQLLQQPTISLAHLMIAIIVI